jgi:hypothetical protein
MDVVQSIGHPAWETLDGAIDGCIEISPIHDAYPHPGPTWKELYEPVGGVDYVESAVCRYPRAFQGD